MKISFVLLSYNDSMKIKKAIRSILLAKIPEDDYEIIVTDDGSTDNTIEIIKEFKDVRLFFTDNGQNTKNQSLGRNIGMKNAKGEYIRFLDGDDYFNSIELYKEYCQLKDADMYISQRITKRARPNEPQCITIIDYSKLIFDGVGNYYIKREVIEKYNLYHDEVKYNWYCEDAYIFIVLYNKVKTIEFLDSDFTYYCIKVGKSNSDLSQLTFEKLLWILDYDEEMRVDLLKMMDSEKCINLLNVVVDRHLDCILEEIKRRNLECL